MAETIDSLLVELGLETDTQSFNEAGQIFTGLRSKALLFGAAIGAVGGLVGGVTTAFARDVDQLGKFGEVYGATAQDISRVGFALELSGGKADDAFASIARLRDLQARWAQGDFPDAAAFFGLDPNILQSTGNILKDYERIANAVQGMGATQRRNALQALGFSDAEIRLFGDGTATMRRYFKEADKFSVVTEEMTGNAADFNDSVTSLGRAIDGLRNLIGNELSGTLTDFNNMLAGFIAEEVTAPGGTVYETANALKVALEPIADAMQWFWGGAADLATGGASLPSLPGSPGDAARMMGMEGFADRAEAREADKGFRFYSAPSAQYGDNTSVTNYNISVDARGSNNPQAVEGAANRAIQKALQANARNAIRDTRTPAK